MPALATLGLQLIRVLASAVVVILIAEVSKRSVFWGSLFGAIPSVSLMGMTWLYVDTKDPEPIAHLAMTIFWMALPSTVAFPVLAGLLRQHVPFWSALLVSCVVTGLCCALAVPLYRWLGIRL